jgi:hypothetical protein
MEEFRADLDNEGHAAWAEGILTSLTRLPIELDERK